MVLIKLYRFIHASLQLYHITRCTRLEDVYHHLDHPPNLDTLYGQAWDRATNHSNILESRRAKLILLWTAFSRYPLTVRALGEALVASGLGTEEELFTEAEIVSCCAGVVRVEPLSQLHPYLLLDETAETLCDTLSERSIVTFVHLSAHHYYENRRETYFPDSNDTILAALLSTPDGKAVAQALLPRYVLMSKYYMSHLHTGIS